MDELAHTSTAVEPKTEPSDQTLLDQLRELQKYELAAKTLVEFLKAHHGALRGLNWLAWPLTGEPLIHINTWSPGFDPAEVARRFPGEWKTGLVSEPYSPERRDWLAERDGVRIRILGAERVDPKAVPVRVTTF